MQRQKDMDKTNVFAINMVKRVDRRSSIVSEFSGNKEFCLTIVPAIEHQVGAVGLWKTLCEIVGRASEKDLDYVVVCEDDHTFTSHYLAINLQKVIADAVQFQADVLLGGGSWFTTCIPMGRNLHWVEKFSGLQFTIIFKKFYRKILGADFHLNDAADYKISSLSDQIYFIHPFISVQKDFGYSDVTADNNKRDAIESLFRDSCMLVDGAKQVISFYKRKMMTLIGPLALGDLDNMAVTTYIINSNRNGKGLSGILSRFRGRREFNVRVTNLCEHTNIENAYWSTLTKIIQRAVDEDEDVIVVCDDDHLFTEAYSRRCLMGHIIEGHRLGTKVLCGGIDDFETAIPITQDKFWIRAFRSSSFIVFYHSVFNEILRQPFFKDSTIESLFREITSNKMVMFPFISRREMADNVALKLICPSQHVLSSRLDKIMQVSRLSSGIF